MNRALVAGALLSLFAVPAWGQDAVVRVVIDKYRFDPPAVMVAPGTVVEWVNEERRTSHSVIVEGQPESERLFPGETYRFRFEKPGRYPVRCGPHPEMMGIVEVAR
jgi:plastocyanin